LNRNLGQAPDYVIGPSLLSFVSPHQFVLRQRIERGKEMLRERQARVLDVAIACGFKTQQHFARVFRQLCGASPREYRRQFLALRSDYAFEDGSQDVVTRDLRFLAPDGR
jgi:AraC-like DNA-binding protein